MKEINLWEEKNLTDLNRSSSKNDENGSVNTITEMPISSTNKGVLDTTNPNSGIYKIINKVNGKYYVGSSLNMNRGYKSRWNRHKKTLRNNTHINEYLQNAWNKYGESNFDFIMVEYVEPIKSKLLEVEQKYLDIAKTEQHKCYNLCFLSIGGGHRLSIRKKLSERNKGQIPWNKGKKNPYSTENLKIRSEAAKGKFPSKETLEKLRNSHLGQTAWNKGLIGIHTEENRKKMSEASKSRWRRRKEKQNSICLEINKEALQQ